MSQGHQAMVYSLNTIARYIGVDTVKGYSANITGLASIEKAQIGDCSFIVSKRYLKPLAMSNATLVIVPESMHNHLTANPLQAYKGVILYHVDPYLAYAQLTVLFKPPTDHYLGVHPRAIVANNVIIGANSSIAPNVVIEAGCVLGDNVIIGANSVLQSGVNIESNTHLYPNVTIGADCIIGQHCIIHSGAVIGADGFGFAPANNGWVKIEQIGNVILGNEVEVGANTTIDRAALSSTLIGNGVKLDNQIQIAHNVEIGEHTVMAASVSIAGSTIIGKHVRIGGAVAISGHLTIADQVIITGRTMVLKSIGKVGVTVSSGTMADDNRRWRKNTLRFMQLDKLHHRLLALEKSIKSAV